MIQLTMKEITDTCRNLKGVNFYKEITAEALEKQIGKLTRSLENLPDAEDLKEKKERLEKILAGLSDGDLLDLVDRQELAEYERSLFTTFLMCQNIEGNEGLSLTEILDLMEQNKEWKDYTYIFSGQEMEAIIQRESKKQKEENRENQALFTEEFIGHLKKLLQDKNYKSYQELQKKLWEELGGEEPHGKIWEQWDAVLEKLKMILADNEIQRMQAKTNPTMAAGAIVEQILEGFDKEPRMQESSGFRKASLMVLEYPLIVKKLLGSRELTRSLDLSDQTICGNILKPLGNELGLDEKEAKLVFQTVAPCLNILLPKEAESRQGGASEAVPMVDLRIVSSYLYEEAPQRKSKLGNLLLDLQRTASDAKMKPAKIESISRKIEENLKLWKSQQEVMLSYEEAAREMMGEQFGLRMKEIRDDLRKAEENYRTVKGQVESLWVSFLQKIRSIEENGAGILKEADQKCAEVEKAKEELKRKTAYGMRKDEWLTSKEESAQLQQSALAIETKCSNMLAEIANVQNRYDDGQELTPLKWELEKKKKSLAQAGTEFEAVCKEAEVQNRLREAKNKKKKIFGIFAVIVSLLFVKFITFLADDRNAAYDAAVESLREGDDSPLGKLGKVGEFAAETEVGETEGDRWKKVTPISYRNDNGAFNVHVDANLCTQSGGAYYELQDVEWRFDGFDLIGTWENENYINSDGDTRTFVCKLESYHDETGEITGTAYVLLWGLEKRDEGTITGTFDKETGALEFVHETGKEFKYQFDVTKMTFVDENGALLIKD